MFGWKCDAVRPPANHSSTESGSKYSQHGGMAAFVSDSFMRHRDTLPYFSYANGLCTQQKGNQHAWLVGFISW